MRATDLAQLVSVSAPTLHPDGTWLVVSATHPDIAADAYVGQLWSVSTDPGSTPRRLTRGFRDTAPRFSPNGTMLAFIRAEPKAPGELFVVEASGGEPVQVTDAKLGVSQFRWSPDGAKLAFVARVPEEGRYGTVEGLDPDAEAPRRISTLRYSANGLGYTIDRRAHVFLVDVPDSRAEPVAQPVPTEKGVSDPLPTVPEAAQLTHGDFDHSALAFAPDGNTLAVVSARHQGRDHDLRSGVFLIDVHDAGAAVVDATGSHGDWSVDTLEYAPNGALFFIAQEVGESGRDFVARNASLYVIEQVGDVPRCLSDAETIDLGEAGSSITALASAEGAAAVLVQNRVRGMVQLAWIDVAGQARALTDSDLAVTGVASAAGTIAISYRDQSTAGDVAVVEGGELRTITDFSVGLRETGLAPTRELVVQGRDGYPVHGWIVTPAGHGPHPVLLNIHGGPFAQYTGHVFDEAQVYADAGYAVVMCNPRGSAGYGQAHGRAIRQTMGTVDLHDVLDFLDGALAVNPELDAARVGIMGGSYGGYLTAWTIAHEHRFAAAIVERGYLDPAAFVGTSDIGTFFSDEYAGLDDDLIRSQSPRAVVDSVHTPTLVLHSAHDLRCPLGQAERYYAALKRRGVEAELVIFPGENHELSRAGRPRHRVQRFELVLGWWAKQLPSPKNRLA